MELESCHIAVLREEVVDMLRAKEGGLFMDATLGGAMHAEAILEANSMNILYGCDRDKRALCRAKTRLSRFEDRVYLFHARFSQMPDLINDQRFDGVLLDLGTSMDQLKENRGFSFHDSSRLDMRMDEESDFSAYELINESTPKELFKVLKEGGVGREAGAVVNALTTARPITRTDELARIINQSVASKTSRKATNPATVVFQALRIAVNREYEELKHFLETVPRIMNKNGRLACISFHSGEDKIVAGTFREWASGDTAPAYLRTAHSRGVLGVLVNRKAITASEEELSKNSSSRSARLRVFLFY